MIQTEQTNHVTREAAREGELEAAVGICPVCDSLSELVYSGPKETPKGKKLSLYSCTVCGSDVNSEYIKWKT